MSAKKPVAVLHVGAMKTGTTYLQNKVLANRDHLAAAGVDVAGRRWRDQVSASQDLLSLAQHDPAVERRSDGAWDRLVGSMRGSDAPVSLVSMEFLSFADEEAARTAVQSIEKAGREVHVVLTVRDTAAVVPALWQTSITSGGLMTWTRFTTVVRAATRGRGRIGAALARAGVPSARRFSEAIDIPRMLRVWTSVLPASQVHVVVVPGPDAPRDLLWEIFSGILDIDPAACPEPPEHVNESLGLASAELVRRVNMALMLTQPSDQRTVKVDLARDGLGPRRHEERRARLDPATLKASLRWNGLIRKELERSGVHVLGDLADLPTEADPASYGIDGSPAEPTTEELLEAAAAGYQQMWRLHLRLTRSHLGGKRRKKYRRRVARRLVRPHGWAEAEVPIDAAVADIALLARSAIRLERLKARQRKQAKRRRQQRRQQRRRQRPQAE